MHRAIIEAACTRFTLLSSNEITIDETTTNETTTNETNFCWQFANSPSYQFLRADIVSCEYFLCIYA